MILKKKIEEKRNKRVRSTTKKNYGDLNHINKNVSKTTSKFYY